MTNFKKLLWIMAIASSMSVSAQTHTPVGGVNRADMDMSVAPGADFYNYACGGWMKANPIEDQYSRFGSFDVLYEQNLKKVRGMFDEMLTRNYEQGSVGQKVSDLYKLAMDSVRLNREGAAPVLAELKKLDGFDRKQLTSMIAALHMNVSNPFFGVGVMGDMKQSDMNTLYVDAPGLGLPDRDYYLNTDADTKKIQQGYVEFMQKIFTLAGYSKKDAKRIAGNVFKLETEFAKVRMSRTESRDRSKLYNVRSVEQLVSDYPMVDWKLYMQKMGLGKVTTLILTQPKAMARVNELLKSMKDQEIKDYLAMGILRGALGYLSDDFSQASFDFYGRVLQGTKEQRPRWKRAQGKVEDVLGEAVGEIYVDKYFAKESKQRMLQLVSNLRTSLGEHIASLPWMSDSTKINALVKLNSFSVKIGYPDKWRDYSGIKIDASKSLYENMCEASRFETVRNLNKYGERVDKDEWGMTPQTINAYYSPLNNEICFPAGILQPPFFDPNADDATNYGAIGVVIGHEMTHGFDDQGRNFNQNGNMQNWWKPSDADNFSKLTDKLVAQFDQVKVLGEEHANGKLTLGENIADQGGLRVSYSAFKKTQQGQGNEKIDGFTPDQRFYLGYARVWATNIRDAEILRLTKVDVHSLGRWRVNATLRNIEPFYKAFDIKEGDPMYLAPADRVVIW